LNATDIIYLKAIGDDNDGIYLIRQRMNETKELSFRVIRNWVKASLVLHMRELKEDNGKTKNKTLSSMESV